MDKREQRKANVYYFLLALGPLLAIALVTWERGGPGWFGHIDWSGIGWLEWISIVLLFSLSMLLQYFFLYLLRYSKLRYVVVVGLPVIWLFNNGIIAMSRFLDWTTDIGATVGWLSVADLFSWFVGVIYFPILTGTGAVAAILDANASMLSQACYYARLALDITDVSAWQVIDFSMNILSIIWQLLSDSFTQEVIKHTSDIDNLFGFSLAAAMSLPNWLITVGYNLACLCL